MTVVPIARRPLWLLTRCFVALAVAAAAIPPGRAWAVNTTADRVLGQVGFADAAANLTDARGVWNPQGVGIDRSVVPNRVYVADTANHRVLAWTNAAAFASGDPAALVIGQADPFSSESSGCIRGGASASNLCDPVDVAIDAAGNVYVADASNSRVLEYDKPFASDVTADRVFGQRDFTSGTCNVGGASATSLCNPSGVAVDAAGNLYVADSNNARVLEFDTPLTSGVSADRVFGQASLTSGTCNVGGMSATSLCSPRGVAVDGAGNLYVADASNNRVLEYNTPLTSGVTADRVFGQGGFTTGTCNRGGVSATSLCNPYRVAVDTAGNLYVADRDNARVLEYNTPLASGVVADRVVGQGGSFTSTACNLGGVNATSLCVPVGVAVDAAGNLYVADSNNNRVLEYDRPLTNGVTADRVLGQVGFVYGAPNLIDARGGSNPEGVAIDRSGVPSRVYVADTANHRVLGWGDAADFASGDPADLVIGQPDAFSAGVSGCALGGASATSLCDPVDVAVDAAGNLYVADASNSRVLEYDTPFANGVVADRVFGQGGSFTTGTCNQGGVSATSLCNPYGVAVDASGNLYVADASNARVLEYDTPLASGVGADRVFGQGGSFTSSTCNVGGVSATSLCSPRGIAVDGAGNLYVADASNNRVLEYNTPLASGVAADRVFGHGGKFASNACNLGGVSATSLCAPVDVAVDAAGNLYIADRNNARVLEYDTPLTSGGTADRVFGQGGFTTGTCNLGGRSATSLCGPRGVAVDAAGNLYVVDTGNNRVLAYDAPLAVCGNGVADPGEACDDGNVTSGDCCSPTCTYEAAASPCSTDGNPCTDDRCNGAGACTHANNTAPCNDGLFCNGADTCRGGACSAHAGDPCAGGPECADTCNEAADTCNDPAATPCTDDTNPCTDDRCNGAGACTHPNNTAQCSDGLFCNGADTCSGGACIRHAGSPCTGGPECADTCNEAADNCFDVSGTACAADNDPCTLDRCNGKGTCSHPPGNDGSPCNDGNTCTTGDACSGGTCTGGTGVACPLCQTCDPTGGCVAGPRTGCKVPTLPQKAQLQLKDATPDTADQVEFEWTRGQATTFAELGSPQTTDDYALCVFDGTDALLLQMAAPAGGTCGSQPCWKQLGGSAPTGLTYTDRDGRPDDLDGLTVKIGTAGKAAMSVRGKGGNIPMPALGGFALPLTAQLQSANGQCWSGSFSTPIVNTTGQFKAKSD